MGEDAVVNLPTLLAENLERMLKLEMTWGRWHLVLTVTTWITVR